VAFHHVAFATRDIDATHRFYTEAMGFDLVKVVVGPTESPGGWAKHLFYKTGDGSDADGGLIAFWDFHDDSLPASWSPAISTGLGLPLFANHLAFRADDLDDIARKRQRLLDAGHTVSEIDHGWCTSIYTLDPNGILVEFCTTTAPFTQGDREQALALLVDPAPTPETPPGVTIHRPVPQPSPAQP
jgi:catechol 2,3-dioxygenase-like lactoylglutathione lyase family enzyme